MSTTDERPFTTPDGTRWAWYWQGEHEDKIAAELPHVTLVRLRTTGDAGARRAGG